MQELPRMASAIEPRRSPTGAQGVGRGHLAPQIPTAMISGIAHPEGPEDRLIRTRPRTQNRLLISRGHDGPFDRSETALYLHAALLL